MAWIYEIVNKKNGKKYIGYTKYTPKHRFQEHWRKRKTDNSILHKAMDKYGKDNFYVRGIEEISESQWAEKEEYWIRKNKTYKPYGYNICFGGNKPPEHHGEKNPKSKLSTDDFESLIKDLSEYKLDFSQISSKYQISRSQVEKINKGESWHIEDLDYPIRKMKIDQYIIKNIIEDLKNDVLSQSEIEEKYKIKSRTRLYNINIGKVGKKKFPQKEYPINKKIMCRKPLYLQQQQQ